MHMTDIKNPKCLLEELSIELTNKLNELTKNFINQYIPEDGDKHQEAVMTAYMAMYNATINFFCHSILMLRDKMNDDFHDQFLIEAKHNVDICFRELIKHHKEVK